MKRLLAITIGGFWLLILGPGALHAQTVPFGGDDPGCAPDSGDHLTCSNGALSAVCKAWQAVIKCHIRQADTVFRTGLPTDDEACERAGGGRAALQKLDAALGKLGSVCTGTTVIAGANMVRDTLFGNNTPGSIDAMNGSIYCDGTTPIDPTGEDAGTVNVTAADARSRQKCADSVNKALSKLLGRVCKCHTKAALQAFVGNPLDEENTCKETVGGKGAHEKYDADMLKIASICTQPCLSPASRSALGTNLIATVEGFNDKFYACATTTTTTTTTTTSTTTTAGPPCCGFPNGGPTKLRFETVTGSGSVPGSQYHVGTGNIALVKGGLYFGGSGETVPLPATEPDKGVSFTGTTCAGTTLTLTPLTAGQTGCIRTCTSPVGTCTAAAAGTCDTTTFACTGTGICGGGSTCTQGKIGLSCSVNSDCDYDCGNDHDCDRCTAGNVGAHCNMATGGDHECSCLFGPPLPIPNPSASVFSYCVINLIGNQLNTTVSGTADCIVGSSNLSLPLRSEVYLTADLLPKRCTAATTGGKAGFGCSTSAECTGGACVNDPAIQPCPICNATTLKCNGGPNQGASCTPGNSAVTSAFPTSHDCPPPHVGADLGGFPMPFSLTTGTATKTSFSTGAGSGKSNIFCGFCKDPLRGFQNPPTPANGCTSDAQCTTAPFTSCEQNLNGAFAHDADSITEVGEPAGDLTTGAQKASTMVSVFCIPSAYDSTLDTNWGLPGPGAVSLPGKVQLLP